MEADADEVEVAEMEWKRTQPKAQTLIGDHVTVGLSRVTRVWLPRACPLSAYLNIDTFDLFRHHTPQSAP